MSAGVSRTTISSVGPDFEEVLESFPYSSRDGIALDLELRGEAHRYDSEGQCAHYLRKENQAINVWTLRPIGSYWEAAILRSLIQSLREPFSDEAAMQVLLRATNRRVEFLVPLRQRRQPTRDGGWFHVTIRTALLRVGRLLTRRRIVPNRMNHSGGWRNLPTGMPRPGVS
jgi:hypothetical protein